MNTSNSIEPMPAALSVEITRPDQSPAEVYLASLASAGSRRTMRAALRSIAAILVGMAVEELPEGFESRFEWWRIAYQHSQYVRTALIDLYQPAGVNARLSALRRVLEESWRLGYMSAEDYRRAADVKNVKYEVLPAGRDVPVSDLRKLFVSCFEDGDLGIRDMALLAVLATCGLRRDEIIKLSMSDVDWSTGALRVQGKGRQERTVFIVGRTRELVDDWLDVRGHDEGALFMPYRKGGKLQRRHMTDQAIYNIVAGRAKRCGLPHTTPHDFRRMVIGDLLDNGCDAVTAAKITGHKTIQMILRYDRRPDAAKKSAQEKLTLPV